MSRTTERLAEPKDIPALVALVNWAYRGEASKKGWTTEADLLGGLRLDAERAAEILATPNRAVFIWPNSENLEQFDACVLLEEKKDIGYLGMLTVRPDLQNAGLGRKMLESAERYFVAKKIDRIEMTVISSRDELIAWYQRRGYRLTGETRAFPMTDPRFGIPKVSHLEFVVMEKSLR